VSDDKDTAERAKELLVYGPLGLALFLRDNGPQFLRMFVPRGRNEVEQRRRTVGEQLDHVRVAGETATAGGGSDVLQLVSNGLASLRERAEEALNALGVLNVEEAEPGAESAPQRDDAASPVATDRAPAPDLAIPGYDDLSASQVVDRLDGLSGAELEAIRAHETAHRARNTILGKIEQLTRGS
jgi:hypothetical protein